MASPAPDRRGAWRFTSRADGDFADVSALPPLPGPPRPWTWLRQMHGAAAVVVTEPGEHAGAAADAAVTVAPGCALAVRTADCAPLVLLGDGGIGVVHAGWRGLQLGVVAAAVEALAGLGAPVTRAVLGPCIRPGCYEFTGPELDELVAALGAAVRATTAWGTPALDLPAAVRAACSAAGIDDVDDASGCTACDTRWFSHRARGERQRCASVAWLEPA